MSLGPKSNFIPVIYAGTNKKNKNGKRKTTRRRFKKSRIKKR
jgi:hypothetical protein